jgi:hypothetical protein
LAGGVSKISDWRIVELKGGRGLVESVKKVVEFAEVNSG